MKAMSRASPSRLMYKAIRQHPPVSEVYAARLAQEGVIDDGFAAEATKVFTDHLEEEFEAAKTYKSNHADWFGGRWSGLHQPADPSKPPAATSRPDREEAVRQLGPHAYDDPGRA
jgi:2-oxoglutarate dehydrogenase E1 component